MNRPTNWDELPLVLNCQDIANLMGLQLSTVYRRMQHKNMTPEPIAYVRPYRWYREAVRAHFEKGMPFAPIGRHARRSAQPGPPTEGTHREITKALLAAAAR